MGTFLIDNSFNPFDKNSFSDEYLNTCREIWNLTTENNVAPIFTLKNLAILTNQEYKTLLYYTQRRVKPYHTKTIKNKNKLRILNIPRKNLAIVQKWIKLNILDNVTVSPYSTAYEKDTSIKLNAKKHLKSEWLIKIDIKDFFNSIKEDSIFKIFNNLGYPKLLSLELARLCTIAETSDSRDKTKPYYKSKGVLPQGSCTSPKLANIFAKEIDEDIVKLLKNKFSSKTIVYTRYSDDIIISGDLESYGNCRIIIYLIREILKKYNLKVNDKKVRIVSPNSVKKITGIYIVNGELKASTKIINYIKTSLFYINKYSLESHIERVNSFSNNDITGYKEHLLGKIHYVKFIDPYIGNKLLKMYEEIIPEY